MRHTAVIAATLAAMLTLAAPARAGMAEDCVQVRDRDLGISGCTAVIRSGQYSGKDLSAAYYSRGIAHAYLGEYRRAIEDFDQALRLDPDGAIPYYNRGLTYRNLGEHARAIEDYDETQRLDPDDAIAYYDRAIALDNLNRSGEGSNGAATGGEAAEITSTGTGSFVDATRNDAYLSGAYKVAVIIGVVALGLFLLLLVFGVFLHSLAVAISMFGWAAESGFVGVALYIILWVVAMPLMLTICIVGGVIRVLTAAK